MAESEEPGRSTTLDVTLRLPTIAALFRTPDLTPFSPSYHKYSYTSGLEYIADLLYGDRRMKAVDATLLVPAAEISPNTEAEVHRAIERFADAKIEQTTIDVRASFLRGRRALWLGVLALTVFLAASRLVQEVGADNGVAETIALGFEIGAWVSLWFPIEQLFWMTWSHRNDRRIYERIRDMQLTIRADTSDP